jgi:hypothetical protein
MTSDDYRDVLIVIAGYPTEIHDMLKTNSGLKSRFTHFFEFPDWEPEDCVSFFLSCAKREGFAVDSDIPHALRDGSSRLKQLNGWANGRDVSRLWAESKSQRAQRVVHAQEFDKKLLLSDLKPALDAMMQARVGRITGHDPAVDPLSILDSLFRMDVIREKLDRLKKLWERQAHARPLRLHWLAWYGLPVRSLRRSCVELSLLN